MRLGISVPFHGVELCEHADVFSRLEAAGYTDMWSSEADDLDGLVPLAIAATATTSVTLGTAILPAFTRGPALLAQSVAALCSAAPGRVMVGIGASSRPIVESWNGIPYVSPYQRTRDTVAFLREALAGERVSREYETFAVNGFRLARPPEEPPELVIAALREGMLRLAGRNGDGAVINWLSPGDVRTVRPYVMDSGDKELVARIFVIPSEDRDVVRRVASRMITAYLNVDAYARYHEWLGRGDALRPMWNAWEAGDRRRALELVSDDLIDELFVSGSPGRCWEQVQEYGDAGVTRAVLAMLPGGADPLPAAIEIAAEAA